MQKLHDLSTQKARFKITWYFHRKNTLLLQIPETSSGAIVQLEVLLDRVSV